MNLFRAWVHRCQQQCQGDDWTREAPSFGGRRWSIGSEKMIRYTCDLCKRELDPESDLRYVVKIEVFAAFDPPSAVDEEGDRDHLQEVQEMLERLEKIDDSHLSEDVYQQVRLDLCPECRRQFLKLLLKREAARSTYGFSNN